MFVCLWFGSSLSCFLAFLPARYNQTRPDQIQPPDELSLQARRLVRRPRAQHFYLKIKFLALPLARFHSLIVCLCRLLIVSLTTTATTTCRLVSSAVREKERFNDHRELQRGDERQISGWLVAWKSATTTTTTRKEPLE